MKSTNSDIKALCTEDGTTWAVEVVVQIRSIKDVEATLTFCATATPPEERLVNLPAMLADVDLFMSSIDLEENTIASAMSAILHSADSVRLCDELIACRVVGTHKDLRQALTWYPEDDD